MTALERFFNEHRGKRTLLEHEVKGLFRELGFSVPCFRFFRSMEDLPPDFGLSFPVVAKVCSSRIASKSDVHGVRLGISDRESLRHEAMDLLRIEAAEGVLIEEMASPGLEVIIGGIVDRQFGPVVMFGLGGVSVELFRDVAFCLAPMTEDDARWLISEVKAAPLLGDFRGRPAVKTAELVRLLISLSEVMATGRVEEIDLNPVALYPDGAMILDAKMKLGGDEGAHGAEDKE